MHCQSSWQLTVEAQFIHISAVRVNRIYTRCCNVAPEVALISPLPPFAPQLPGYNVNLSQPLWVKCSRQLKTTTEEGVSILIYWNSVCLSTFTLWCQERALLSTQEVVNHNLSVIQSVRSIDSQWTLRPETDGFANIRSFFFPLDVKHQRPTGICAVYLNTWLDLGMLEVRTGHRQRLSHKIEMMQIRSIPLVDPPPVMYHL